jgi:flagellar basal body-associated protein FliL
VHCFLLLQFNQIRILRHPSSLSEITRKLSKLKSLAIKSISMGGNPAVELSYLSEMKIVTDHVKALYHEFVIKWPNNSRLSEDFSYFLVEGATDFSNAVKQKNRANLIEQGKNFVIDFPFRSLIRKYPAYLRKKIVDTKGKFIYESSIQINSSQRSSSNQNSSSTTEEIDPELEKQLTKSLFTQYRMRMACQRAFKSRKSKTSVFLIQVLFFSLILGIGVILFTGFFFSPYFSSGVEDLKNIYPLEHFLDSFLSTLDIILIYELNQTKINNQSVIDEGFLTKIRNNEGHLSNDILNFSNDFISELDKCILSGIRSMNELENGIITQSLKGIDVNRYFALFVQSSIVVTFCGNDQPYFNRSVPKPFFGYMIYLFSQLRFFVHNNTDIWVKQSEVCETFQGYFQVSSTMTRIINDFDSTDFLNYESIKSDILFISLICLISFFVICFPLLLVLSIFSFKELKNLLILMQNVDPASRNEATLPLNKQSINSNEELNESSSNKGLKLFGLIILVSVFVLSTCAFILIVYFLARSENEKIRTFNIWSLSDI